MAASQLFDHNHGAPDATTGAVEVATPGGTLASNVGFTVK